MARCLFATRRLTTVRCLAATLGLTFTCSMTCQADEQPQAAVAADNVELRENVDYGQAGEQELTLHLARPKNVSGKLPALVYIHGGGWRGGNKDIHKADIVAAAERGYLAVSVGYRLVPAARFPAQVEDVKCAVRWLRAHADQWSIDPGRIGAIGFSAGAHLSLLLGTMDSTDGLEGDSGWPEQSSKVQAVVAYFGPTNFVGVNFPITSRQLVVDFLGGPEAEQAEHYRQASPLSYVNAGDAPTLIFHGTADILVPYDQALAMGTALAKVRVPGRVEMMLGAGHGWGPEETARTRAAGFSFFAEHLAESAGK